MDLITSMTVAMNQVQFVLGKLAAGLEAVKQTDPSKQHISTDDLSNWLIGFKRIEEVATSFRAKQEHNLQQHGSLRRSGDCEAGEQKVTGDITREARGKAQEEDEEEEDQEEEEDEAVELSLRTTNWPLQKYEALRSMRKNQKNNKYVESSGSPSSSSSLTSSDCTIKPIHSGT